MWRRTYTRRAQCGRHDLFINTSRELMTGDFVQARVTGAYEYDLIGELEDEFTE